MRDKRTLEIIIITYNRSVFLDYTLSAILGSDFCTLPITVLDNCSTDDTEIVCKKYSGLHHNIKIIRHKKNIGASANYLRAVEIASCEYAWVLCDDDVYDFSYAKDVLDTIERRSADLIFVGSWERILGQGESFSIQQYYDEFCKYFSIGLYIPSVIFRVEKFNAALIRKGYLNSSNLFPHFSFILECYENDLNLYVSKKQILYCADDGVHGFSKLDLTVSYLNLSEQIKTSLLRNRFIDETVFHNEGFLLLIGRVIVAKAEYGDPLVYNSGGSYFYRVLFTVFRLNLLSMRHRLWFVLSAIASLTPRPLCKIIANVFAKKIMNKYNEDLPEEILKLRRERLLTCSFEDRAMEQIERMKNT
jgi:glycosyltransferase involved in cell wall biosynthesis